MRMALMAALTGALFVVTGCTPAPVPMWSPDPEADHIAMVACEDVGAYPTEGARVTTCYEAVVDLPLSSAFPAITGGFAHEGHWLPEDPPECRDGIPEKSSYCSQLFTSSDESSAARVLAVMTTSEYVAGAEQSRVVIVIDEAACAATIDLSGCGSPSSGD